MTAPDNNGVGVGVAASNSAQANTTTKTLYQALVEAGVPVSSWQSDLYAPRNEAVREILAAYPNQTRSTFRSNVDGRLMYEFPFAYGPFWEARAPQHRRRSA